MKYLPLFLLLLIPDVNAKVNDLETECLALNVYHEARGESLAGQYAVADVVLNRLTDKRYPDTICGVVKEAQTWKGNPVRNKCQFSWYCDGKPDVATQTDAWMQAVEVAISILYYDKFRGITEGATHYHTDYVNPNWNRHYRLVGTIGDHIFYINNGRDR